jgi:hypothetical protein
MLEQNDWIARKAYELWEKAGRPDGQDRKHWQDASDHWQAENQKAGTIQHDQSTWDDEGED